ncbi:hypothetical protein D3H65_00630 [Paraflavitalea soli]|uniref:Uncharacterized protein n=1 Tax=Paraflavitalea soli TaxID=2315862 RepID=A0A3B7MHE0_9BACT|nr:hypothetical protein D3H65_00630 [Paraflavitalea soli]
MKSLKFHIVYTLLVCLGALLLPGKGIACDKAKAAVTTKCAAQTSAAATGKDANGKHCDNNDQHGSCKHTCNGKCGHKSCTCTGCSASAMQLPLALKTTSLFAFARKQRYHASTEAISSGFYSTWLPPKIG